MSPSSQPHVDGGAMIVPITEGEPLLRNAEREASILLARKQITITHARYAAGQQVAGPHIHHRHTDAFYVLEGELTFEIGREANTITVGAGDFVAAPPRVAHSFRTDGDQPARWLTIHAHDGGFATFIRGARDGVKVNWDISPIPADGGLPTSEAIINRDLAGECRAGKHQQCRLRCALPDLRVIEWRLHGPPRNLPLHQQEPRVDSFFVIAGELEATLAGTAHTVGPGTLISIPPGAQHTIHYRGSNRARILSLHRPIRMKRSFAQARPSSASPPHRTDETGTAPPEHSFLILRQADIRFLYSLWSLPGGILSRRRSRAGGGFAPLCRSWWLVSEPARVGATASSGGGVLRVLI
jgi:quercetin dioxygenase-like cupin family protein